MAFDIYGEGTDLDPYEDDEYFLNLGLYGRLGDPGRDPFFDAGRRALSNIPGILAGMASRGRELSGNAGGYEDIYGDSGQSGRTRSDRIYGTPVIIVQRNEAGEEIGRVRGVRILAGDNSTVLTAEEASRLGVYTGTPGFAGPEIVDPSASQASVGGATVNPPAGYESGSRTRTPGGTGSGDPQPPADYESGSRTRGGGLLGGTPFDPANLQFGDLPRALLIAMGAGSFEQSDLEKMTDEQVMEELFGVVQGQQGIVDYRNKRIQEVEKEIEQLRQQDLAELNEIEKQRLEELDSEFSELREQRLQDLNSQIEERKRQELKNLESQIDSEEDKRRQDLNTELENERNRREAQLESEIANLSETQKQEARESLARDMAMEKEQKLAELDADIKSQRETRMSDLESDINQKYSELSSELEAARETRFSDLDADYESKLSEYNTQVSDLQQQIQQLTEQYNQMADGTSTTPGGGTTPGDGTGTTPGDTGEGFDYEKFFEMLSAVPAFQSGTPFQEGEVPGIYPTAIGSLPQATAFIQSMLELDRAVSPQQAETALDLYRQITSGVREAQSPLMQSLAQRSEQLGAQAESLMGPLSFLEGRGATQTGYGQAAALGRAIDPGLREQQAGRLREEQRNINLQLAGNLLGQQRATAGLMADIESGIYGRMAPDIGVDPGQILGIAGTDIQNILGERIARQAAEAERESGRRSQQAKILEIGTSFIPENPVQSFINLIGFGKDQ